MSKIPMIRCGKSVKTCLAFFIAIFWIRLFVYSLVKTESPEEKSDLKSDEVKTGGNGEHGRLGTPAFINIPELGALSEEEIARISKEIGNLNEAQHVFNSEKFGQVDEKTFVIVIQVHSRVEYLRLLIDSLSRVQDIENCLLVFSHDLFLPLLNDVIQSIGFARVIQIFYPFSIQLHPNSFPGQSPDDCPRDIQPAAARKVKCSNSEHPDVHGHYREARYTQTKHHWWWKANFVFEKLNVLHNYTGVVGFLEEDHYVSPDFLWILNIMETDMIQNKCEGCNLISLGTYLKAYNFRGASSKTIVTNWISSKHNMGMAFNRTLWTQVKKCGSTFCNYDDYNWDWSILQVSYHCLPKPLSVYYPRAPRIFHIGDCGVHHKKKSCNPKNAANLIERGLKEFKSLLFPDALSLEVKNLKRMRLKKGNGGWGDNRDKNLCLSFSS